MALALSSPVYWWLGWVTLLPLFFAIRILDPSTASLAGGLWGAGLLIFSAELGGSGRQHSAVASLLLTLAPAVYAAAASAITRKKGFHPLLLALGWVVVELAVQPLGIRNGLLAHTQGDGILVQFFGHVGGYVLIAFIIAMVNAVLVSAIVEVGSRLFRAERSHPSAIRGGRVIRIPSLLFSPRTQFAHAAYIPRGPPFSSKTNSR